MQYIRVVQKPNKDGAVFFRDEEIPILTWRTVASTYKPYVEVQTPTSTITCYPVEDAKEIIVRESLRIISDIEQQLVYQLQNIEYPSLQLDKNI